MATTRLLRVLLRLLLFPAAVLLFYLGLGLGLAINPLLGTFIWILAGGLFFWNLWWLLKNCVRAIRGLFSG